VSRPLRIAVENLYFGGGPHLRDMRLRELNSAVFRSFRRLVLKNSLQQLSIGGDRPMPKITPFLWFDNNAEEAVQFYTSIFKNSKTTGVTHYPEEGPGPAGTVMTITFQLDGQEFIALNGGPVYQFLTCYIFVRQL
jgi:hypothetical protein